jgi:LuxR family transcriptional regulator of csgAB operon
MQYRDSGQAFNLELPTEKAVYIFGPRRLQNQIVARCLERETGLKCVTGDHISQVPSDGVDGAQPGVILLDCQGADPQGLLAEVKSHNSDRLSGCPLVLFNASAGLGVEERCVWEGIEGFFYEQDSVDQFLKGVAAVLNGEMWLPRTIMTKCIREGRARGNLAKEKSTALSPRQMEILALVAVGCSNDEIGDNLCISTHTVKVHLYNIYKKIDVSNRLQAAFWAAKNL